MECAFLLACLNLNATSLAIICQTLTKVQISKPRLCVDDLSKQQPGVYNASINIISLVLLYTPESFFLLALPHSNSSLNCGCSDNASPLQGTMVFKQWEVRTNCVKDHEFSASVKN